MKDILVVALLTLFAVIFLMGIIFILNPLICFIHYKITGNKDWNYKYFGTKYEKQWFKELNYCLEHISEFKKTHDYIENTNNFLNSIELSENDRKNILQYFQVVDCRMYVLDNYKIEVSESTWMITLSNKHITCCYHDKYIANMIETKLKEYNLI